MSRGLHPNSKSTQFKKLAIPLELRFHNSYVPEPNSGCWIWIAGVDNKGYGRITIRAQILAIRQDVRSQSKIARSYGISQSAVSFIKNKKRWSTL